MISTSKLQRNRKGGNTMRYDKEIILAAIALMEVLVISVKEIVLAIVQSEEE